MFSSKQPGSITYIQCHGPNYKTGLYVLKDQSPLFLSKPGYSSTHLKISITPANTFPKNQIFIIPKFPQKSKSHFHYPSLSPEIKITVSLSHFHPYPFHLISIISPSCHQLSQISFQKSIFPSCHNNSRQSYPHDSPSSHRFQVHLFTNQVLYCVICSI